MRRIRPARQGVAGAPLVGLCVCCLLLGAVPQVSATSGSAASLAHSAAVDVDSAGPRPTLPSLTPSPSSPHPALPPSPPSSAGTLTINNTQVGIGTTSITYSTGWTRRSSPGGDDSYAWAAGRTATLRFTGTKVVLYGNRDKDHGRLGVSLDGGPETVVDAYANTPQYGVALWTSRQLANAPHTLRVRVVGLKHPASTSTTITLDRFVVSQTPGTSADYVSRRGASLYLRDREFRFTGVNSYETLSDNTAGRGCGGNLQAGRNLADHVAALGAPSARGSLRVVRLWFFQRYSITGTGQRDWSFYDKALAELERAGLLVVPVLGNHFQGCEIPDSQAAGGYWQRHGGGELARTPAWYQQGYKVREPNRLMSYRNWVTEVVTRYRDRQSIAFWQLMNEAEAGPAPDGTPGVSLLRAFADDMGGLVKSIDANHLVSLGSIGSGQAGMSGEEYATVHASAPIDLCELHVYAPGTELPGDQWNGVRKRVEQCGRLGKPLFVGEFGNRIGSPGAETEPSRAGLYRAKLNAYFGTGMSGALAWNYTPQPGGQGTFDIGPGDPALSVLRESVSGPRRPASASPVALANRS